MAITDLGHLAAGGSRTADQATLTVTTVAACNVGELVVVAVAVDNAGADSGLADISVASVTLGGVGNFFTKILGSGPNTGAQTGPSCAVFWCLVSAPVASGQNLVVTFNTPSTADHSAVVARRFSGPAQYVNGASLYVATALDFPSLDVTTANEALLRIRAIAVRRPTGTTPSFGPTVGWTAWNTAFTGSPIGSPDWEMYCNVEFVVFTGTNKISDPSASGGDPAINANVYVTFREIPIAATLAATESGSDSASFPGGISTQGTLEACEGAVWLTADSTVLTADNDITRVNSATILRDVAAFSGQVLTGVTGVLAATEGADTASFAGLVGRSGVLAATESADTAAFAGTVAWPVITGTLVATEASDAAAFSGLLSAFGILAATEARDTAAFAGGPVIAGMLAVTEAGSDTAVFTGVITNAGVLAAVEVGSDTAAFTGFAFVAVTLAATEARDTATFEGYLSLVDEKIGILNAFESGGYGETEPRADSTIVTADQTIFTADMDGQGGDRASFTGGVLVGAVLAATEAADAASFAGIVPFAGVLAATEAQDTAAFAGGVGTVVTGVLAAREDSDTARFNELQVEITGVLAAQEASDHAHFSEAKWEDAGEGAGLRNEIQRTLWLTGLGGRVTWLENEVEDTSELENLNPEVISLLAEQERITRLGA